MAIFVCLGIIASNFFFKYFTMEYQRIPDNDLIDYYTETIYGPYREGRDEYGKKIKKTDSLIIVPHGGRHEKFHKTFPELNDRDFLDAEPDLLKNYHLIEEDSQVSNISHMTAKKVLEKTDGLISVKIIETPDIPRGYLDTNRLPQFIEDGEVIRNVFNRQHPSFEKIRPELIHIYFYIIYAIRDCLKALDADGVFVDMHSMNSDDAEVSPLTPSTIRDYVYSLVNNRTRRRAVNLLTAYKNEHSIAHPTLEAELIRQLNLHDYPIGLNDPYFLDYVRLTGGHMRGFYKRGLCIDWPAWAFSAVDPDDPRYDPIRIIPDSIKLELIADMVSNAIIKCFEHRL